MRKYKQWMMVVFLWLGCMNLSWGFAIPIHDPMNLIQMVRKFTQEISHWKKQNSQWTLQKDFWAQELQRFLDIKEKWKREEEFVSKLLENQVNYGNIWSHFFGPVSDEFNWEDLRLQEIEDLSGVESDRSGNDPYSGLFGEGKKIEDVFEGIRDWTDIKASEKYKNNPEFKGYIDGLILETNRMLDDLQNKIKVISQLNRMIPQREKKFQEIQKRLEDEAKKKIVNNAALQALNGEVNLELSRELFHLVTLNRIETENQLLSELRDLNRQKFEEKEQENTSEKDEKIILEMFGSQGRKK